MKQIYIDNEENNYLKDKSTANQEPKTNFNTRHSSKLRFVVLLLCCLSVTGDYFCFDLPAALKSSIRKRFNAMKDEDYNYSFTLMYSVYTIPNMILPLIGGFMIILAGNRKMYLLFSMLVALGQFVFALGISQKNIETALIGRAIFGLGGESLNTTQSTLIMKWFASDSISLVFGVFLSWARLSAVFNDVFSPRAATEFGVASSTWIGFSLCVLSFFCTIILVYLDWRQDIIQGLVSRSEEVDLEEKVSFSTILKFNKVSNIYKLDVLPAFSFLHGNVWYFHAFQHYFNFILYSFLVWRC